MRWRSLERGVELVAPVAGPKVEVEAAEMTAGKDEAKEAAAPEAMEEPAPAEDPVAVPAGEARPTATNLSRRAGMIRPGMRGRG